MISVTRPRLLVFHIGDHKTGSTAIQYAFARGAVQLQAGTASYPAELNHTVLRHHCDAFRPQGTAEARAAADAAFARLAKRVRSCGEGICLISAESLEKAAPEVLAQAVARHFREAADEIRVVAYVRPHMPRFLSNFTEQVKIGRVSSPMQAYHKSTLKNGRFCYRPRFEKWRQAFGEAFILRPFVREQLHRGDVVADLLRHGFSEEGAEITGPAPANGSLCLQDLMRLKLLQGHMQQHPQALRHALGWEFARLIGTLPPPDAPVKLRLHRKLAARLHDSYLEDARAMDRDFFAGAPLLEAELDRALAGAAESPQKLDPAAHLEAAEIRSLTLMAQMVSGMLENGNVNWVQHFRLQRIAALKDGAP